MNVKLRVLSMGVLFFTGQALMAQTKKRDTATKTKDIQEVVLVGYGRKETTTEKVGNYAVVGKENLENTHFTTVDNALTGSVAGVATNMTSGQPGANVNILIRGVGSLTQDTTPLIIIDGIPQYTGDYSAIVATTNALASINSNDIEELVVLKDAAATSIYGSRGANGVILIKTKGGRKGKAKFNFNSSIGFNQEAFNKLKLLNAQEQIDLYALGEMNAGRVTTMEAGVAKAKTYFGWNGITNTNWKEAVTRRTPYLKTYNFQASGGSDIATIFASLSYDDYQGIAKDAVMQRLTATVNSTFKMSDKIDLRAGFTGGRVNTEGPIDNNYTANPIKGAYQISPTQSIWKVPEDPTSGYNDKLLYYTANSKFNSVAIQQLDKNQNIQGRVTGYLEGTYNITPEIYFTSKISGYLLKSTDFGFRNPTYGDGATNVEIPTGDKDNPIAFLRGRSYAIDATYTTWAFTNFAGYSKVFADRHSLKLDVGMEVNKYNDGYVAAYGYGYDPFYSGLGYTTVNNSESNQLYGIIKGGQNKSAASLVGYITGVNYSFDKKYTINGTIRRDGSSRFGAAKRWGNFWSIGASWNVDRENFLNSSIFKELKLRASYGTQGRQPDGYYSWFSSASFTGYNGQGAFAPNYVDKDLRWESQKQLNLGLDFGLFNNKISGSIDYFDKKGTDQIIGAFYPGSTIGNNGSGGGNSIITNIGDLTNKGIEAVLNFSPVKNTNFQWDVQTNFTFIKSTVDRLPTGDQKYSAGGNENTKMLSVGHNPSEWYLALYAGVDKTNGHQLWYTDATRTTTTDDIAKVSAQLTGKNSIPTRSAGLTNTLKYKGFILKSLFSYMGDYSVYDLAAYSQNNDGMRPNINQYASSLYDSWTVANPNASNPMYVNNNPRGRTDSTRYLYDADHIRLKNVEFGFTFTKDLLNIPNLDSIYVFLQGQNVATWAFNKSLYFDPESSSNHIGSPLGGAGIYNLTAPIMKTYIIGFKVNF